MKGLLAVVGLALVAGLECRCTFYGEVQAAKRAGQGMEMTANPNEVAGCKFITRVDSRMQAGDWANQCAAG